MNVWFDVDNAPQARYLLPLARALERRGHRVVLTARDHGETVEILEDEGAAFHVVGTSFGRGIRRKLVGLVRRTRDLGDFLARMEDPIDLVVTGSRAATLAARRCRLQSFVIIDYEHVDFLAYRLAASNVLHPDVIDPAAFERRGIKRERLLPFHGLKEDLSFSGLDLDAAQAVDFGAAASAATVLFRPPAEESHYYRTESRQLALALLRHLAVNDVQVVLSPRDPAQIGYVDEIGDWARPPIVLERPAPFVALLKGVDAVVSAGGTMLREAAYLGVPAYSIFRSRIGAVDRYLASIGRLAIIATPADFSRLTLEPKGSIKPLRTESRTADEIAETIEARMDGSVGAVAEATAAATLAPPSDESVS